MSIHADVGDFGHRSWSARWVGAVLLLWPALVAAGPQTPRPVDPAVRPAVRTQPAGPGSTPHRPDPGRERLLPVEVRVGNAVEARDRCLSAADDDACGHERDSAAQQECFDASRLAASACRDAFDRTMTAMGFTAPIVRSVAPSSVTAGQRVTITGQHFRVGVMVATVSFARSAALVRALPASDTALVVDVPPDAASGPVLVTTVMGRASSAQSLQVAYPRIDPPLRMIRAETPTIARGCIAEVQVENLRRTDHPIVVFGATPTADTDPGPYQGREYNGDGKLGIVTRDRPLGPLSAVVQYVRSEPDRVSLSPWLAVPAITVVEPPPASAPVVESPVVAPAGTTFRFSLSPRYSPPCGRGRLRVETRYVGSGTTFGEMVRNFLSFGIPAPLHRYLDPNCAFVDTTAAEIHCWVPAEIPSKIVSAQRVYAEGVEYRFVDESRSPGGPGLHIGTVTTRYSPSR